MNEEIITTKEEIYAKILHNQVVQNDNLKVIKSRLGIIVFFFITLPIVAFILVSCLSIGGF